MAIIESLSALIGIYADPIRHEITISTHTLEPPRRVDTARPEPTAVPWAGTFIHVSTSSTLIDVPLGANTLIASHRVDAVSQHVADALKLHALIDIATVLALRCEALITPTLVGTRAVLTGRVGPALGQIQGTLIVIGTDDSIPGPASQAFADKASRHVATERVITTIIQPTRALVDVAAGGAIGGPPRSTLTLVGAYYINALRVRIALSATVLTLIQVDTRDPVTDIALNTRTLKTAIGVGAQGMISAIVEPLIALMDILATPPISSIARRTSALIAAQCVLTEGVLMTVVGIESAFIQVYADAVRDLKTQVATARPLDTLSIGTAPHALTQIDLRSHPIGPAIWTGLSSSHIWRRPIYRRHLRTISPTTGRERQRDNNIYRTDHPHAQPHRLKLIFCTIHQNAIWLTGVEKFSKPL